MTPYPSTPDVELETVATNATELNVAVAGEGPACSACTAGRIPGRCGRS